MEASRLCTDAGVEVTTAVDVTTAVEKVVVSRRVSEIVDVIIVVSVVRDVTLSGTTNVLTCVCC
jgi:hypothetical protein